MFSARMDVFRRRAKTKPERPARLEVRAFLEELKNGGPDADAAKRRVVERAKVIHLNRTRQLELFSAADYVEAPPEKRKRRRRREDL